MKRLLVLLFLAGSLAGHLEAQQPRRPFGWKSNPNHARGLTQFTRHVAYRAAPLPASASVDEAHLPDTYDQLFIGSCVAQAAAAAFDHNWKARTGYFAKPSRLDIYQNCLRKDGVFPRDYGTYTSTVLWVLKNKGTLLEATWGYNPNYLSAHAPTDKKRQRQKYAAVTTFDVSNTDNGYSVKQAIANAKLPVLVGGYVYEGIFHVKKADPFIPMPSGKPVGGHEMLAIAYDDNMVHGGQKGFVKLRNSWADEWGDSGDAFAPYAYIFNPKYFEDFGAIQVTGRRVVTPRASSVRGSSEDSSPSRSTLRWPWQKTKAPNP